ncbi:hypothetical protein ACPOM7_19370 [Peribacillus castrilensis]|uniref:Uncharacterized protein n=1 Tax=Peribacillus simplex TaxID=1478 RepID=A0AAN2PH69_9BACI|nr:MULTISPECIES: hypothetical protein [Bacillaceae]MCF7622503.1 hypothetical protein [Peribacillus frigoritolerans]NCT38330.1 hypothetical protein [Peribacillus frigoritolerans]CEG32512.1 hypothetical protein BN1180_02673 [Peribacillus simplex]
MEINERQPFESFLSPRQLTELKILSIKTNIAFHELLAMPSNNLTSRETEQYYRTK